MKDSPFGLYEQQRLRPAYEARKLVCVFAFAESSDSYHEQRRQILVKLHGLTHRSGSSRFVYTKDTFHTIGVNEKALNMYASICLHNNYKQNAIKCY